MQHGTSDSALFISMPLVKSTAAHGVISMVDGLPVVGTPAFLRRTVNMRRCQDEHDVMQMRQASDIHYALGKFAEPCIASEAMPLVVLVVDPDAAWSGSSIRIELKSIWSVIPSVIQDLEGLPSTASIGQCWLHCSWRRAYIQQYVKTLKTWAAR